MGSAATGRWELSPSLAEPGSAMMGHMKGGRPGVHTWAVLALAVGAVGVTLLAVSLFSVEAPYVGFLDLARAALPSLTLAVAAGALTVLGRGGSAPVALVVSSIAVAAPNLSVGLQQRW